MKTTLRVRQTLESGRRHSSAATLALFGATILVAWKLGQTTGLPLAELAAFAVLLCLVWREGRVWRTVAHQSEVLARQIEAADTRNRWLTMTEALAHVGHWRLDLTDNSLFWSDETFRIHGLEPGTPPPLEQAIEVYHPDDRETVANAVESARRTGEFYRFQARLIRPDGEIRHTEAVAHSELDDSGKPVALFGVFADRTEEVLLRQDLLAARDVAQEAAEAKSGFLARMSHEIRTPMNAVIGFADLLLRGDLDPVQRRQAEFIAESGSNLTLILNDILDLSKIEAGEMALCPEATDLHHHLRRCLQLVDPAAREKNLHLSLDMGKDVPRYVMVDPLRLRQIVSNLLNNALRFTDRGYISLRAEVRDARMLVSVQDSGIGIPEDRQEIIFDSFAQADANTAQQRGGTGLGLSISRQLAAMMDGTLTLQSKPGLGSTFTLEIPLVATETPVAPAPAPAPAPLVLADAAGTTEPEVEAEPASARTVGPRVLLAEDFDINQELIMAMAERIGLDMALAVDGVDAVRMVRDAAIEGRPFELVLMDLQMPNMDGLEASRRIREAGFDAETLPIIALTANAFADDIAAARKAGMQEHLAKPLPMDGFEAAIKRWLPGAKRRAA